jgi:Outer membrane efflux protein
MRAAMQAIEKAQTDHRLAEANGSTDPTLGVDFARDPPIPLLMGVSVSIPLRIFDRNQGEKARTQLDIGRNERLRDAVQAQVFNDVDSAYAAIESNLILQGELPGAGCGARGLAMKGPAMNRSAVVLGVCLTPLLFAAACKGKPAPRQIA